MSDKRVMKLQSANVNIRIVRRAAALLLSGNNVAGADLGVRCLRDVLITTIQMRRRRLKEGLRIR